MVPGDHAEEAIVPMADGANGRGEVRAMDTAWDGGEDSEQQQGGGGKFSMKDLLWHGGSVWDAWFSCASNQVWIISERL
jgi:auxin influx carrier (AUX1 LAX family)